MYHPTEVKNNWNTYSLCKAVTISGLASPCSDMDIVFFRWFRSLDIIFFFFWTAFTCLCTSILFYLIFYIILLLHTLYSFILHSFQPIYHLSNLSRRITYFSDKKVNAEDLFHVLFFRIHNQCTGCL